MQTQARNKQTNKPTKQEGGLGIEFTGKAFV
jgi:hypothetical protein